MAGRMDTRAPDTRYTGVFASEEKPREAHQTYLRGPAEKAQSFCASVHAFVAAAKPETGLSNRVACTVVDHANGQASAHVESKGPLSSNGLRTSGESPEKDSLVELARTAGAMKFVHCQFAKEDFGNWLDGQDRNPTTGTAVFGRPSR